MTTRLDPSRRRWLTIGAGVLLLAVPTAYTVFASELAASALWIRLGVIVLWLAAAVLIATLTRLREERSAIQLDQLAAEQKRRVTRSADALFEAILSSGLRRQIPETYAFTIYRHDHRRDVLIPIWPVSGAEESGLLTFHPGAGATGYAWSTNTFILAVDDAVSDSTFGLTPDQQEFFSSSRTVAAVPICGPNDERLGVLTSIGAENDGAFETEEAQEALRDLAAVLGVLLDDLDVTSGS